MEEIAYGTRSQANQQDGDEEGSCAGHGEGIGDQGDWSVIFQGSQNGDDLAHKEAVVGVPDGHGSKSLQQYTDL